MLTNIGLVEHCKKALDEKWGYVWGTFGMVLTEKLFADKLAQYPDGVGKYKDFIKSNWINRRTADCVGLIKSYLWWNGTGPVYNSKNDVSADGMKERAKETGTIDTMPDIPGICVWHKGHIGVYIGNGQVIEAHGTKYGVIQTPLKGPGSTGWSHWLKCPYIEYVEQPLDWKEIIRKISDRPDEQINAIVTAQNAAKADGNLGALEIFKFLPELIVKVYNAKG